MQQMEWREALMDAQMEQNNEALRALDQEISCEQDKLYQDLRTAFAGKDHETAAQWVRHGRFLNKLRNESPPRCKIKYSDFEHLKGRLKTGIRFQTTFCRMVLLQI